MRKSSYPQLFFFMTHNFVTLIIHSHRFHSLTKKVENMKANIEIFHK